MPARKLPNPKITESFLKKQTGVVDAFVWLKNGTLLSRVVVSDDACLDAADLQQACIRFIGEHQAPTLIMLSLLARSKAVS